jgi:hypothetical protein
VDTKEQKRLNASAIYYILTQKETGMMNVLVCNGVSMTNLAIDPTSLTYIKVIHDHNGEPF